MAVWKRKDWNEIIQRINDLSANPSQGCDPLPPLEEVGPNHRWSKSDIRTVQDRLTEICSENQFSAELRLWSQSVIDEINAAIAAGWCGCEGCELEENNITLRINEVTILRRDFECVGMPPIGTAVPLGGDGPPPVAEPYDFMAAASALRGKPNQRGSISLLYGELSPAETIEFTIGLGTGSLNCDGTPRNLQRNPRLGNVGDGPWDYSGVLAFDTYSWRRAGDLFCPVFNIFVDWYYIYCQGGTCQTLLTTPRFHAQAIGLNGAVSAPPTPKPPPDWQSDTAGHLAAIAAQDAVAASYMGRKQIWSARVTSFAGCHKCCGDGKGFQGFDCPHE